MLEFLLSGIVWAEAPKEELSELKESPIVVQEVLQKKETPFKSISHPDYSLYREALAKVIPYGNHCALFVNRMVSHRYGFPVYGDAWTMQLHKKNQEALELVWRLPETEFKRHDFLNLYKKEDRIKHYNKLYEILDGLEDPQGVIGFTYRFSFHRENLAYLTPKQTLAQTHVGFMGGNTTFSFHNTSTRSMSLESLIAEQYGALHNFEKEFVSSKVNLSTWLKPGDEYFYTDYSVEEYFKGVKSGSLLSVFLRKHENNRTTPLLRPVSYSNITPMLREKAQAYN